MGAQDDVNIGNLLCLCALSNRQVRGLWDSRSFLSLLGASHLVCCDPLATQWQTQTTQGLCAVPMIIVVSSFDHVGVPSGRVGLAGSQGHGDASNADSFVLLEFHLIHGLGVSFRTLS